MHKLSLSLSWASAWLVCFCSSEFLTLSSSVFSFYLKLCSVFYDSFLIQLFKGFLS